MEKRYERPEVLATYTTDELAAAACIETTTPYKADDD
jgi:hypothetical protein